MCKTWHAHCGRQHVGACEQRLHSDGVLLQNGGRQIAAGESGILLISSISTRKHAVEFVPGRFQQRLSRPGRHTSTDTRQLYQNCV